MLNIITIEDALYAWVNGVTSLTTIFAHQDAPRPSGEYVLINILQSTPNGWADQELTLNDTLVDVDYSTVEELFISINVYRGTAFQTATKLKDSLARVTENEKLYVAGLGYSRVGTINDIPEEIDKQWEQRAQFDCFFFTRSLDEETIETIRKVEITNNINDDGDTVIIEKP